jgi:hypothetical protein
MTSLSACRMTATVDASYFCFRSIIVTAPIIGARLTVLWLTHDEQGKDQGRKYPR